MSTFDKQDGFRKFDHDQEADGRTGEFCEKHGIDGLMGSKLFPVLARRQALKRFLAHTALFQTTAVVPGDIAELGVYRGAGLFTWANLLECYCIGDRTKTVYGFENWTGFSQLAPEDGAADLTFSKVAGGFSPAAYRQEVLDAIAMFDADRFCPWKPRIKLVDGPLEQTAPQFVKDNPGVRFSLLHFDVDLYRPTLAALQSFWPRLSVGGVALFDEYGQAAWPGETAAVDAFLFESGQRIRKPAWTNAPAAYVVKE